jgi:hypothetical protein
MIPWVALPTSIAGAVRDLNLGTMYVLKSSNRKLKKAVSMAVAPQTHQ